MVLDTSLAAAGGDTLPPSIPSGLNATASTTQTRVTLTWNASTDNVGVTGYTIYRNGSALGTVSGSTLTYNDNTVASLATYSYTADAFDAAGTHSTQSTAATVTTPDTTRPSTPGSRTASPVSPTEADLGWNPASDNL